MSYLEAVEKHNKKKVKKHKKNAFINMTEEPKLTRQKLILQDIPVFQTEEQEKKRQQYEIECIDAIKAATGDGFEPYLQGNILKYLWRYNYKNGIEDLKKAQWYLSKLIEVKNGNKS